MFELCQYRVTISFPPTIDGRRVILPRKVTLNFNREISYREPARRPCCVFAFLEVVKWEQGLRLVAYFFSTPLISLCTVQDTCIKRSDQDVGVSRLLWVVLKRWPYKSLFRLHCAETWSREMSWMSLTEGLHDAIHTYMHRILPHCLVSFFIYVLYYVYKEKEQKNAGTFDLLCRTI